MTLYIGNEGGTASHFDPSLIGMGFFMSLSETEPKKNVSKTAHNTGVEARYDRQS